MPKQKSVKSFHIHSTQEFQQKLLEWAQPLFKTQCFLNSNNYSYDIYGDYQQIFAAGEYSSVCVQNNDTNAFELLKNFVDNTNDWVFGFLSYDLKNQLENLKSSNIDNINMPLLYFFRPAIIFIFKNNKVEIDIKDNDLNHEKIFSEINGFKTKNKENPISNDLKIKSRVNKEKYIKTVKEIKEHIKKGDIYEMNYCIEFYNDNAVIDPLTCFRFLNEKSPSPFAAFFRLEDKYLVCSSPERYLKKKGRKLISQPIKGTIKRGKTKAEDMKLRQLLYDDPKERSENVMIVDLVRNDLSITAKKDSVKVPELFGIYSFPKVSQMISTITSELDEKQHFTEVIKTTFPMGSMTGAPKIKAMEYIEKYEDTMRGLYSGAVGYINPAKDFDFNVVIRSILYNEKKPYISFMAGSAITVGSDPEKEYKECLLKAKSLAESLTISLRH